MFAVIAQSATAYRDASMLGLILGTALSVVVCAAIPFMTGVSQKKPMLGIVGSLVTIPGAALLGCIGGLPLAAVCSLVITCIPKVQGALLSESEIEAEMRRASRRM